MNLAPELTVAEAQTSELKAINADLRGALSLLHSTLESTADGILVVDKDGKFAGFNQQFVRMWHIPQAIIDSKDDNQALTFVLDQLKDAAPFLHKVRELYANPEMESFDALEFKDGRIFERYSQPRRIGNECMGRVWSFRDVTAQRQAEQLIRQQSTILEMVAQNLNLNHVLSHVASLVESHIPNSFCCVLRLNGEQLAVGGATSTALDALLLGIDSLRLGAGLTVAEEDPVHAATWQPYRTLALQHGFLVAGFTYVRSAAGEPLGVIIVHYQQGHTPSSVLTTVLGSASKLTALAVEHAALADRLSYQAQYDALTGLPNRALFQDRLRQAIDAARNNNQIVAVLFMDLDGFKRVNDTLGHRVGDKLLKDVAARFHSGMRGTDTLARHGGDEFMAVITGIRHAADAMHVAQFMLTALDKPFIVRPHEIHLTASIGISLYPNDGEEEEQLLLYADAAMYKAKAAGHNSFECFTPELHAQLVDRIDLEDNLFHAISRGELALKFQPMHQMDQSVMGFEALLRWAHPTRGMIAPDRFIPIAEESGLIVPIGRWVLEESCRQCAKWRAGGYSQMRVSVNVSATQFEHPGWTKMVAEALAKAGLAPDGLELELTEHLVMRHPAQSIRCINTLKEMGVSIAIDDFGTGYSSLAYLQQLPINTLKIDRSFISGMKSNSPDASCIAIVEAIVKLGAGLGMQVMAEGVETKTQLTILQRIGCHAVQGYYYARPMTATECGIYLVSCRSCHRDNGNPRA